jgi:hypothetical protein
MTVIGWISQYSTNQTHCLLRRKSNMARAYQVRSFDSLLKSRIKNTQMRQKIYKNLLTRLVQDERVVTTLAKCKDLSRVAERVFMQFVT